MDNKVDKLRIGILAGIADLYNRAWPETQVQLNVFMGEVAEQLEDIGFEVLLSPAVSCVAEVEAVCQEYSDKKVDLILVALALYCPSGIMMEAFKQTDIPLLLWPVQSVLTLKPQTYSDDMIRYNHGVHAVQDWANTLVRSGKRFGVIHGHLEQEDFVSNLRSWVQSGRALNAMRRANPVQIGGHFEDMLDLQVGGESFMDDLGVKPILVSLDELADFTNKTDEQAMESYIKSYQEVFDIRDEVDLPLLQKTARGHGALDKILKKHESSAFGLNFLDMCNDERILDPQHVWASVLMSQGGGYGGEGDWVTAILVYGLQQALGGASFSEMFSVGYSDNRLLVKHFGEGNFAMARSRPVLKRSCINDKHKAEFITVDFEFKPGATCLINLNCDAQGKGQLISIQGTITEDALPLISGPRAIFEPNAQDVRELLTNYTYHGGSHHLALVQCECRDMLERISRLSGWSYFDL